MTNIVYSGVFVVDNAVKFTQHALRMSLGIRDQSKDYAILAARFAVVILDVLAINQKISASSIQDSKHLKDASKKLHKKAMVCEGTALVILLGAEKLDPEESPSFKMGRLGGIIGSAGNAYDLPIAKHIGPASIETVPYSIEKFKDWYARNAANAKPVDMKNLDYKMIPDEHHDDDIFNQFICPITFCPIRFPVTAPNKVGGPDHHFERAAIVEWLSKSKINPLTKKPLHLRDLKENDDMRQIIEDRMKDLNLH